MFRFHYDLDKRRWIRTASWHRERDKIDDSEFDELDEPLDLETDEGESDED